MAGGLPFSDLFTATFVNDNLSKGDGNRRHGLRFKAYRGSGVLCDGGSSVLCNVGCGILGSGGLLLGFGRWILVPGVQDSISGVVLNV